MKKNVQFLILAMLFLALFGCQIASPEVLPTPTGVGVITQTTAPTQTFAPTQTLAPTLEPTLTLAPTTTPPSNLVLVTREMNEDSQSPKYEIRIQYPFLEWDSDPRVDPFNQAAETLVMEEARAFKEGTMITVDDPNASDMLSTLQVRYTPTFNSGGLLSVKFYVGYYIAGAAHPGNYSHTLTFDLNQGSMLHLEDLFLPGSNYLETIAQYSLDDLKQRGVLEWEEGALPKPENYRNWNIAPSGLIITFDEYQVASYAAGPQAVLVPFSELEPVIRPDGPLGSLVD